MTEQTGLSVECPRCHAAPGEPCRIYLSQGRLGELTKMAHAPRVHLFLKVTDVQPAQVPISEVQRKVIPVSPQVWQQEIVWKETLYNLAFEILEAWASMAELYGVGLEDLKPFQNRLHALDPQGIYAWRRQYKRTQRDT